MLYVEQPGLEVEQRLTRRLNRLQALAALADWLQGKVTHPLSACVKESRPRAEVQPHRLVRELHSVDRHNSDEAAPLA